MRARQWLTVAVVAVSHLPLEIQQPGWLPMPALAVDETLTSETPEVSPAPDSSPESDAQDVMLTPATEAPMPPPQSCDVPCTIRAAAQRYGVDPGRMLRIAWCESRYDPGAVNRHDGSLGLFQFQYSTWLEQSPRAGWDGANVFDPRANAEVAAYLMAHGQGWRWTCT